MLILPLPLDHIRTPCQPILMPVPVDHTRWSGLGVARGSHIWNGMRMQFYHSRRCPARPHFLPLNSLPRHAPIRDRHRPSRAGGF